jgi:ABC-type dipeptide/oligopeptide/nickel transport system permease subunit
MNEVKAKAEMSLRAATWRRFKRRKTAVFGLCLYIAITLIAILSPFISPRDPNTQDISKRLLPPNPEFPFGTDEFGRCILSRILYGGRISLSIGIISVAISAGVGTLLGLISGFYGGKAEIVIMRVVDIMLCFPGILLALIIVSTLGRDIQYLMIAVGISGVPNYARMIRGAVLSLKENEYIEAARAAGASHLFIMSHHILPNVLPIIIILTTLSLPGSILSASALSFIGLGVQPPTAEWGRMLGDGRAYIDTAWWISTFPGLMIFVTVISINLVGDGLRDALDPRLKA